MPRGEILSLEQGWLLSKLWYADRLNRDFTGRTLAEVRHIFGQVGLTTSFWQVD